MWPCAANCPVIGVAPGECNADTVNMTNDARCDAELGWRLRGTLVLAGLVVATACGDKESQATGTSEGQPRGADESETRTVSTAGVLGDAGQIATDEAGGATLSPRDTSGSTGSADASEPHGALADGGFVFSGASVSEVVEVFAVPLSDPREQQLLVPLTWSDEVIDSAEGEELVKVAFEAARARGYTVCRCVAKEFTPPSAQEAYTWYEDCAEAEGWSAVNTADSRRCVADGLAVTEGLDEYLRCQARWYRAQGQAYLEACDGEVIRGSSSLSCTQSVEIETWLQGCLDALYCSDGVRLPGTRCDGFADCADAEDELDCGGIGCDDGSVATTGLYCDGRSDCDDGSDEQAPLCAGL